MIDQIKGWAGVKLNGLSINIDIVDNCVLRCPSCAQGSIGGRKPHKMDFVRFTRILDKIQIETKIRHIMLYVYSDPFQHPELHRFVGECTRRGIKTWLSTMLQTTFADFARVIAARPTEFRISLPGWDHMAYYQKGAKPEKFDEKFAKVCKLPRHPETTWTMFFQVYDNNQHEIPKARKLAEDNGIKFVAVPSIFMPLEKVVEGNYSPQDDELISHLIESPEEALNKMKRNTYCTCWKQLTLDARGQVYLCQLIYEDRFILGKFFDKPIAEWRRLIQSDPYCSKCISVGANVIEECYSDFTTHADPVGHANKKRRK